MEASGLIQQVIGQIRIDIKIGHQRIKSSQSPCRLKDGTVNTPDNIIFIAIFLHQTLHIRIKLRPVWIGCLISHCQFIIITQRIPGNVRIMSDAKRSFIRINLPFDSPFVRVRLLLQVIVGRPSDTGLKQILSCQLLQLISVPVSVVWFRKLSGKMKDFA